MTTACTCFLGEQAIAIIVDPQSPDGVRLHVPPSCSAEPMGFVRQCFFLANIYMARVHMGVKVAVNSLMFARDLFADFRDHL